MRTEHTEDMIDHFREHPNPAAATGYHD